MTHRSDPGIAVGPADRASCGDLTSVIAGAELHDTPCYCRPFKILARDWYSIDPEEPARRVA